MGYFSNGSEGDAYEEQYCSRCIHNTEECGCPVWGLHLAYNYKQFREGNAAIKDMLSYLIPRNKETTFNEECRMFVKREEL